MSCRHKVELFKLTFMQNTLIISTALNELWRSQNVLNVARLGGSSGRFVVICRRWTGTSSCITRTSGVTLLTLGPSSLREHHGNFL